MNHLNTLLEKTSDWDKDERYMATNDLMNELLKDAKIDEIMEKRICAAVLKQLDDHSNEVQSVAVKCLSILLKKVKDAQIREICDKLSSLIIDGKSELRDIYSIGLKTLINDVPEEMGPVVCNKLVDKLLHGIKSTTNENVKRECIDILSDLLRRFGHFVDLTEVTNVIVSQLENGKHNIKKRAANCLGSIAVVCSDSLLISLVETVVQKVESTAKPSSISDTKCYIQTLAVVTKTVGYRLGKLLTKLVSIFVRFCGDPEDEDQQTDDMNEIRDNCFLGLESFALRQPQELLSQVDIVLDLSIQFMKYDPNYSYDDEGDHAMADDYDEAYDDQDDNQGGAEEEDDSSWKVRKNAVKVIHAIIIAQPSLSSEIFARCFKELIGRFKEREENVRIEVILCCHDLLSKGFHVGHSTLMSGIKLTTDSTNIYLPIFSQYASRLLDATVRQLNSSSSVKTKSVLFSLLRTVVMIEKEEFQVNIASLLNCVKSSLVDSNQVLRLECLQFLRVVLDSQSSPVLREAVPTLLPLVISSVNAEWYKIIAEGVRVLNSMILNLAHAKTVTTTLDESAVSLVIPEIYTALLPRLEANDIDVEIKESVISAIGNLFALFGYCLTSHIKTVLSMLRRRLDSEVTRIYSLRCLSTIANSEYMQTELNTFFNDSATELAMFLRQQNRLIKLTALQAIDSLLKAKGMTLSLSNSQILRLEISNLFNDSDLQLCTLSLQVVIYLITNLVSLSSQELQSEVYERAISLAASPLIQGSTQVFLVKFFQLLVTSDKGGPGLEKIFTDLRSKALSRDIPKQSIVNLSKCIGGVCVVYPENIRNQAISQLVSELQQSDDKKLLALFCLGEIGKSIDLVSFVDINNQVLACFDNHIEEIKSAAAYCLGHLAVGNLSAYLPIILAVSNSTLQHQYLLLVSLKEIIAVHVSNNMPFRAHIDKVLPALLAYCGNEDEALRSIIADSLGNLACLHDAENVLSSLKVLFDDSLKQESNNQKLVLRTVMNAYKFSLSRKVSSESSAELSQAIQSIFPLLRADDLEVRKSALLCVHAALHHNFDIIIPFLDQLQPLLAESLLIKAERVVDLGPFKHKVDDGVVIRKSALLCVEEILLSLHDQSKIVTLLDTFVPEQLTVLLVDKDEIKLQVHQVIIKVCNRFVSIMTPYVDVLIDPLEKGSVSKKTEGLQGPELERAHELLKSNLRVIVALNDSGFSFNHRWQLFFERITKSYPEIFASIKYDKISNI